MGPDPFLSHLNSTKLQYGLILRHDIDIFIAETWILKFVYGPRISMANGSSRPCEAGMPSPSIHGCTRCESWKPIDRQIRYWRINSYAWLH